MNVTEAAERLRTGKNELASDTADCAREYLRLTDSREITPEWLLSVGFADCTEGMFILTIGEVHDLFVEREDDGWKATFLQRLSVYGNQQVKLPLSFTRGQLRMLAAALGVELKEPTK